jgi:ABC-type branched-subunit amino acid transport system ATPase component
LSKDSYSILEKIGLEKFINEFAKNLPYGAQRRLEIARALATEPLVLLLDEPAAGMNVQETRELDDLIIRIRKEEDISILLIEHDMKLVMSLSDRIYVLDYGKKIAEGTSRRNQNKPCCYQSISRGRYGCLSSSTSAPSYGNIKALNGVSLEIFSGEIVTLIGANGAGKTTTLMSICGIVPPRSGEIYFEDKLINGYKP